MLETSVMDFSRSLLAADYSAELGCIPQYFRYISLCLLVRRNAAILLHRAGTRVVRRQRQARVAVELLEQPAQELRSAIQALLDIERVADAEAARRRIHQLRETLGAHTGLRFRVEVGLGLHQASQQRGFHPVLVGRGGDLVQIWNEIGRASCR